MSSAISTDAVRSKQRTAGMHPSPAGQVDGDAVATDESLQPWQFFVLAGLACATVVTFLIRGQGLLPVVLLTVLMGSAALIGLAVLRTIWPLVSSERDRTVMIGDRTRAALEREKVLTLRSLKDLEFDRAMGKVSEDDYREMTGRLRARAVRLIRQLDAEGGYRNQIERELASRLDHDPRMGGAVSGAATARSCASCATVNELDARFCKSCGSRL